MAIVTKESVFGAAEALAAKGINVTQNAIRKELGGGSYSSIGDLLTQWRQSQVPTQPATPIAEPAPESLQERFGAVLAAAWGEAIAMANTRLAAEREALAGVRTSLEKEKADAVAFADGASADLEAAQAQIAQLTAAAEAQAQEHGRLLADSVAQVGHLRQQLAQVEADHAATKAGKAELALVVADTRSQHAAAQADVARLTGELKAAEAREAAQTRAAASADKRETQATAKADKAAEELAETRMTLADAKARAKAAEGNAAAARMEAQAARTAEGEARTELTTLRIQLDAVRKH
jgi:chromosome segregation ATPase